jgi:hypothetical protein
MIGAAIKSAISTEVRFQFEPSLTRSVRPTAWPNRELVVRFRKRHYLELGREPPVRFGSFGHERGPWTERGHL